MWPLADPPERLSWSSGIFTDPPGNTIAARNAIVFGAADRTLGVGGGATSRVDAMHAAVAKAARVGLSLEGSVLASDAFFPFPDGLEGAVAAGARAVVQPGGSNRDELVIEAADRLGVAMVFTGVRHFRH